MKIKFFPQTDTLHIELRDAEIVETRDIDENTQIDLDAQGITCAITIEHASERTDVPSDGKITILDPVEDQWLSMDRWRQRDGESP